MNAADLAPLPDPSPLWVAEAILNDHLILVQRDLADAQRFHVRVKSLFDPSPWQRILYRPDVEPNGVIVVTIQAPVAPDPDRWPDGYLLDWRAVQGEQGLRHLVNQGAPLRFRLRANPTMRIDKRRDHPLAGKRISIRDPTEQMAWLERKLTGVGAELISALVTDGGVQTGVRTPAPVRFESVRFDGSLRVTDSAAVERAVRVGVGVGKGYGLGLLSLGRLS